MTSRRRRAARLLFATALLLTGVAAIVPALPGDAEAAPETAQSATTRTVTATR